jgi:PAS domain S-box-containing protein
MEIDDDVFSFMVVPVEGSDYVNIYGLDITRRRRMEKALKKSERQFRDLVENSLVGIGILRDGNIIYRNPEQERLWGTVSDRTGGSAFDHVHPDDADKVQRALQQIVGGKSPYVDMELRMIGSTAGDEKPPMKWVHCRASLTEHQGAKAVLVNMMDVTRIKQLENLLRVEDKMASLGRVAAGIAHEIRNPLSGINIYLSTLEKIYDKKESHDTVLGILERLKSASDKIESVIRRVMDFAKPGMPHFVMGNINEPVEEAINLASVTLRKRGIKIEKRLSTNLSDCRIDRQMIESVVLNLITNAIEAMKDVDQTNKIRVSSYVKGNHVRVTVSDSGPGIPPGLQDSIFDPFYTTKNGSTGIGLSLSRRFIADHGGSLRSSKSRLGGGKFTIEIPIAQRKHTQ